MRPRRCTGWSSDGVERWSPEPDAVGDPPPDGQSADITRRSTAPRSGCSSSIAPTSCRRRRPPLLLTGYGGFAIVESPAWLVRAAAWCAAGGVFAVAGLRGGYEHGEAWHHAGRRANKQNVFDDFHAAADWLVARGLTSPDRLAIDGGSNGGLLVGVAITQRPDLARAVWCAVPLLDMIRFPQFLIARLWTDEYGDPDVAEEFGWLHAYSPYHHVSRGRDYSGGAVHDRRGRHPGRPDARPQDGGNAHGQLAARTIGRCCCARAVAAGHGVGKPASMRVRRRRRCVVVLLLATRCRDLARPPLVA